MDGAERATPYYFSTTYNRIIESVFILCFSNPKINMVKVLVEIIFNDQRIAPHPWGSSSFISYQNKSTYKRVRGPLFTQCTI